MFCISKQQKIDKLIKRNILEEEKKKFEIPSAIREECEKNTTVK